MSSTSDPNELQPLTEAGNRFLQERIRKIPEFATSSKWGVAAIVLQLSEGNGFEARVGVELRTPLAEPFQDMIVGWGGNKEDAARAAVGEWLELALPAALAVHSDKDSHARLGETQKGNAIFTWRLAQGVLWAKGPDADEVKKELGSSNLFDRLGMAGALPLERELPWMCVKLQLARSEGGVVSQNCRLNNNEWPAGFELLKRFHLPGVKELEIKQYLFVRRTGKRAAAKPAAPVPAAVARGPEQAVASAAVAPSTAPAKKPWWKVW